MTKTLTSRPAVESSVDLLEVEDVNGRKYLTEGVSANVANAMAKRINDLLAEVARERASGESLFDDAYRLQNERDSMKAACRLIGFENTMLAKTNARLGMSVEFLKADVAEVTAKLETTQAELDACTIQIQPLQVTNVDGKEVILIEGVNARAATKLATDLNTVRAENKTLKAELDALKSAKAGGAVLVCSPHSQMHIPVNGGAAYELLVDEHGKVDLITVRKAITPPTPEQSDEFKELQAKADACGEDLDTYMCRIGNEKGRKEMRDAGLYDPSEPLDLSTPQAPWVVMTPAELELVQENI